ITLAAGVTEEAEEGWKQLEGEDYASQWLLDAPGVGGLSSSLKIRRDGLKVSAPSADILASGGGGVTLSAVRVMGMVGVEEESRRETAAKGEGDWRRPEAPPPGSRLGITPEGIEVVTENASFCGNNSLLLLGPPGTFLALGTQTPSQEPPQSASAPEPMSRTGAQAGVGPGGSTKDGRDPPRTVSVGGELVLIEGYGSTKIKGGRSRGFGPEEEGQGGLGSGISSSILLGEAGATITSGGDLSVMGQSGIDVFSPSIVRLCAGQGGEGAEKDRREAGVATTDNVEGSAPLPSFLSLDGDNATLFSTRIATLSSRGRVHVSAGVSVTLGGPQLMTGEDFSTDTGVSGLWGSLGTGKGKGPEATEGREQDHGGLGHTISGAGGVATLQVNAGAGTVTTEGQVLRMAGEDIVALEVRRRQAQPWRVGGANRDTGNERGHVSASMLLNATEGSIITSGGDFRAAFSSFVTLCTKKTDQKPGFTGGRGDEDTTVEGRREGTDYFSSSSTLFSLDGEQGVVEVAAESSVLLQAESGEVILNATGDTGAIRAHSTAIALSSSSTAKGPTTPNSEVDQEQGKDA
ncbi:unnamed protein product, partial [Discosporangium mesarthrocarpum]